MHSRHKHSIMAKFSPVKHKGMVLNTVHKSDKKTGKSAHFGKKWYKNIMLWLSNLPLIERSDSNCNFNWGHDECRPGNICKKYTYQWLALLHEPLKYINHIPASKLYPVGKLHKTKSLPYFQEYNHPRLSFFKTLK